MKRLVKSRWRFIFFPVIAVALVFLVGFIVMTLWNLTLPAIFGIATITLWQAMALFVLCKLLFGFGGGGPHKGGPGPSWRRRSMHRWYANLDEEEKERLNTYLRTGRCGWERRGGASAETDHVNT